MACLGQSVVPVTVIVKFVVASKCDEGSKTNTQRPVDLGGSINPHLQHEMRKKLERVHQLFKGKSFQNAWFVYNTDRVKFSFKN